MLVRCWILSWYFGGGVGGGLFMVLGQWLKLYVHSSVHLESMSIIVQQDATVCSFITFLQTILHVSDDNFIHHQEHTQNCNYNIWHWSNRTCYHPLTRRSRKCSCESSASKSRIITRIKRRKACDLTGGYKV